MTQAFKAHVFGNKKLSDSQLLEELQKTWDEDGKKLAELRKQYPKLAGEPGQTPVRQTAKRK
ncbi:hypothetical protein ACFLQU_04155 [Verrucomicrobiota bacterium]